MIWSYCGTFSFLGLVRLDPIRKECGIACEHMNFFGKPQNMKSFVLHHLPLMTFGCNAEEQELRVWCNCASQLQFHRIMAFSLRLFEASSMKFMHRYISLLSFFDIPMNGRAAHVPKRQFWSGVLVGQGYEILYFESTNYSNCIITWHVWILTQICDFVVIARLLNATLVLPKFHDIEAPKHSRWVFFLQHFGTQWDFFALVVLHTMSMIYFHWWWCILGGTTVVAFELRAIYLFFSVHWGPNSF